MNCAEFKAWLLDEGDRDQNSDQDAKLHRLSCEQCQKLYALDQIMEKLLVESFVEVEPPADLFEKLKRNRRYADHDKAGPALRWKILAPALAIAVIIAVVFINPFSGQIRNIAEIRSLAVANHLNNNMKMAFKAGQISDISAWFAERIGYPVAVPDMTAQGFKLLGGRQCSLGKKKAAYLIYEKDGRKCSLFIINPHDLAFKLESDKSYSTEENHHKIKVWSKQGLVYAMVM